MSLIVGQYYRGDPKQKPKQWGSDSAVQSALYSNLKKLGIDPSVVALACPLWCPGNQHDYANNLNGVSSGVNYYHGGQYFTTDNTITFAPNSAINNPDKFTIFIRLNQFDIVYADTIFTKAIWYAKVMSASSRRIAFTIDLFGTDISRLYSYQPKNTLDNLVFQWTGEHNLPANLGVLNFYRNGVLQTPDSTTAVTGGSTTNDDSSHDLVIGNLTTSFMDQFVFFRDALTFEQIESLNDNPWQLWQPPIFRAYFDLAESGVISGSVTDGFYMSDSVGKQAIFSVMAQESMSFADIDQNLGNFIAALVDQIELSAATGRTAILNVSSNDSFSFFGAVSSIQKILALVGDDINVSETLSIRADITATVQDVIEFSESFVVTLQATAVINEIINLSDTVSTDALLIISALAAEVFSVSNGVAARANLISSVLENFTLSEGATNFLAALAAASETINISDLAFWQGIQYAFATDDIAIASTSVSLLAALATSAESIHIDDSGAVKATFNVEINDVLQFAETISAIATLRGSLSDGIRITATPLEISTLPNGKVSVSFSLRKSGADFEMRTTTIVFNLK